LVAYVSHIRIEGTVSVKADGSEVLGTATSDCFNARATLVREIIWVLSSSRSKIFGDRKEIANKHDAILVTAGRLHNLRNIGHGDLKLFAVFSPPSSGASAIVHKAGAAAAEEQLRYAWEQ
jgi:hypothetical protein